MRCGSQSVVAGRIWRALSVPGFELAANKGKPWYFFPSHFPLGKQVVVFTTSKGSFEAEIYADKMPITAGL